MLEILLERISPNESICVEDEKESKSASVEETADTDFLRYNPCLVMHYNDNNYFNKEVKKSYDAAKSNHNHKRFPPQDGHKLLRGSHHNMDGAEGSSQLLRLLVFLKR